VEERHAEIETIKADYDEQFEEIQVGGTNKTIISFCFHFTSMLKLLTSHILQVQVKSHVIHSKSGRVFLSVSKSSHVILSVTKSSHSVCDQVKSRYFVCDQVNSQEVTSHSVQFFLLNFEVKMTSFETFI
jgi:hypothetical protein